MYDNFEFSRMSEMQHQKVFIKYVRNKYSDTFGKVVKHNRNENAKKYMQEEGLCIGASDIDICAKTPFVMELKRADKSAKPTDKQIEYLETCSKLGAFCCVCWGYKEAIRAFEEWLLCYQNAKNI
jgi:hypothetical protein